MFCTNIQINNLEYKEPQANRSGGKVVHVSTLPGSLEWKDRIRFQMSEDEKTNLQTAVWGLGVPLPGQDMTRRTLELTIESPPLLNFLQELDENNIKMAVDNSPTWFKKSLDEQAIRNMYVKLVKTSEKPGETKKTVRVKVKCGDYPTNIYVVEDSTNGKMAYRKGGPDDLARNVKCMVMVETVGLWFMSRQYGMSLSASEIIVWPSRRATGIDAFTLSDTTMLHKVSDESIAPNEDEVTKNDDMMLV